MVEQTTMIVITNQSVQKRQLGSTITRRFLLRLQTASFGFISRQTCIRTAKEKREQPKKIKAPTHGAPAFLIISHLVCIGTTVFPSQSLANVYAANDKEDKISILQRPYFISSDAYIVQFHNKEVNIVSRQPRDVYKLICLPSYR